MGKVLFLFLFLFFTLMKGCSGRRDVVDGPPPRAGWGAGWACIHSYSIYIHWFCLGLGLDRRVAFVLGKIGIGYSTGENLVAYLVGWLVGWWVGLVGRSVGWLVLLFVGGRGGGFLEPGLLGIFIYFYFPWQGDRGLRLICLLVLRDGELAGGLRTGKKGSWRGRRERTED